MNAQKRWYTKYKHINQLLELTRHFPENVQKEVGTTLTTFVKNAYERMSLSQELKNLGPDKILGLYLSQQKRRWSDRIPELHYSLKFLATMPHEMLLVCDEQCVDVVSYINSQMRQNKAPGKQDPFIYAKILRFLQSDDNPLNQSLQHVPYNGKLPDTESFR